MALINYDTLCRDPAKAVEGLYAHLGLIAPGPEIVAIVGKETVSAEMEFDAALLARAMETYHRLMFAAHNLIPV